MDHPEAIVMPNDRAMIDIRLEASLDVISLNIAQYLKARGAGIDLAVKEAVAKINIEDKIRQSIETQVREFAFRNVDLAVQRAFHEAWGTLQDDIYKKVKKEVENVDWSKQKEKSK